MLKATYDGTRASIHRNLRDAINAAIAAGAKCWLITPAGARVHVAAVKRKRESIKYQRPGRDYWHDVPAGVTFEWTEPTGVTQ